MRENFIDIFIAQPKYSYSFNLSRVLQVLYSGDQESIPDSIPLLQVIQRFEPLAVGMNTLRQPAPDFVKLSSFILLSISGIATLV